MSPKSPKSGGKSEPEPEPRKLRAAKPAASKSAAKKSAPAKKTAARKSEPASKAPARKTASKGAPAKKTAAPAKKAARSKAGKAQPVASRLQIEPLEALGAEAPKTRETTSESAAMVQAYRAGVTSEAEQGLPEMEPAARRSREPKSRKRPKAAAEPAGEAVEERAAPEASEREVNPERRQAGPEPHLERLQKILSQAGVASRRHAEEMIVAGRVIVNGQTVTQLGAKADPARDHIRVDGKLLETEVRHRTFMLHKPKGYVTTVSDPEGRPTVMQFFDKVRERLYPVGRLDFQSEGLLLVTNDGELANALTRAASGVEKIYVVKVAGQPGVEAIERLRSGISIERGDQGSDRVRTAPAQIRQIRQGDNPWFEVILTEGRNRELRKMFQAIGHYVEKIRRVAYGPLVLDIEPGQIRELHPEEMNALRLTAAGKLKPRRPRADALLPKEAGKPAEERTGFRPRRGGDSRPPRQESGPRRSAGPGREFGARKEFGSREERPFQPRGEREGFGRQERPGEFRPDRAGAPRGERPVRREDGPRPEGGRRFDRPNSGRPSFDRPRSDHPSSGRPNFDRPRPGRPSSDRPSFGRGERRPLAGPRPDRPLQDRPREERGERPRFDRGGSGPQRPRFDRGGFGQRPAGDREQSGREERPRREFRPREEGAPRGERPRFGGDRSARPSGGRPAGPAGERPARFGGGREGGPRREGPPRSEGQRERRPGNNRGPQNRPGGGGGGRGGGFRKGGPPRRDRG